MVGETLIHNRIKPFSLVWHDFLSLEMNRDLSNAIINFTPNVQIERVWFRGA